MRFSCASRILNYPRLVLHLKKCPLTELLSKVSINKNKSIRKQQNKSRSTLLMKRTNAIIWGAPQYTEVDMIDSLPFQVVNSWRHACREVPSRVGRRRQSCAIWVLTVIGSEDRERDREAPSHSTQMRTLHEPYSGDLIREERPNISRMTPERGSYTSRRSRAPGMCCLLAVKYFKI